MTNAPLAPARQVSPSFYSDPPAGNAYALTLVSDVTSSLSAGDTVFSFRTGTSGLFLVTHIAITVVQQRPQLVATALQVQSVLGYIARGFTASDSGGIAATLTGNSAKTRTSDQTTGVQDIRIASTGTLTAGTRTLDTHAVMNANIATNTTLMTSIIGSTFVVQGDAMAITLAANEGLVFQVKKAYADSTVGWRFIVAIGWVEVPAAGVS